MAGADLHVAQRGARIERGHDERGAEHRWDTDDLFVWSLCAPIIYIRAASERTGATVAAVSARLAARHGVELAAS